MDFLEHLEDVPSLRDASDPSGTGPVGPFVILLRDHEVRRLIIHTSEGEEAVVTLVHPLGLIGFDIRGE